MSYSTLNPPQAVVDHGGLSGAAIGIWRYSSTDPHGTVSGSGYFANGGKLGMKVGDAVIVVKSDTGATTIHSVTTVGRLGPATISAAVLA